MAECVPGGGIDQAVDVLLESIQEQFLERHLYRAGDGSTLPLGVAPTDPNRWLELTYPLDWRTDLVEILDLVATADDDPRLQSAVRLLADAQLTDGSWPLQRTFRPAALPLLERRNVKRGSWISTLRALCALSRL